MTLWEYAFKLDAIILIMATKIWLKIQNQDGGCRHIELTKGVILGPVTLDGNIYLPTKFDAINFINDRDMAEKISLQRYFSP